MKNTIFGCAKWCCKQNNRYRRNFLGQIGLVDRLRGSGFSQRRNPAKARSRKEKIKEGEILLSQNVIASRKSLGGA